MAQAVGWTTSSPSTSTGPTHHCPLHCNSHSKVPPATGVPVEAHPQVFRELACLSSQNMLWEYTLHGNTETFCVVTETLIQKRKPESPLAPALNSGKTEDVQCRSVGPQGGECPPLPITWRWFLVLCVPGVVSMDVASRGPCFCVSAEIRVKPTGPV